MKRRSRQWLRAAPWLVALVVALLHAGPEALRGEWLVYRDAADYLYPNELVLRDALGAGALPHWNPWIWGGVPHLADPPTQGLYPPRLATAALPLSLAPHAFLALHLLLAGAGAGRLARALGARTAGSCLAAAAYPATGFVVSLQESLPSLTGIAWLPWALWAALALGRAVPARVGWRALFLGLFGALFLLGGNPWAAALACGAGGALLLLVAGPRRALVRGGLAGVVALGVAAPLLLPGRALASHTSRALPWPRELAGLWSTSPWRALELWAPWPFGAPWPDPFTFRGRGLLEGDRTELFADTLYPGGLIPLLALAALVLASARGERARRALALTALLALLLALGRHAPFTQELARAIVPGFDRLRYPEKWLLLPVLAAPVLAGVGLHALRRRFRGPATAAAGLALVLLGAAHPLGAASGAGAGPRLELGAARLLVLIALAAGALRLVTRARSGRARLGALLLVIGVAAGDPLLSARQRRWTGAQPPWRDDACLAALRERVLAPGPDGLAGRAGTLPATGIQGGVVRGQTYAVARELATLRGGPGHELQWESGFASFVPLRALQARALPDRLRWELLGVRALVARGVEDPPGAELARDCPERGWRILKLPALPRAWCVNRAATAPARDLADAFALVSRAGFDPHAHAVLEGAPAALAPLAAPLDRWPTSSIGTSTVRGRELAGGGLELEVEAREPVTLIVSVGPFPGWKAEVDGAPAAVHPASLACLGVPLEPGSHRVRLAFSTPGFWPGVAIAALTLLVVVVGARVRAR